MIKLPKPLASPLKTIDDNIAYAKDNAISIEDNTMQIIFKVLNIIYFLTDKTWNCLSPHVKTKNAIDIPKNIIGNTNIIPPIPYSKAYISLIMSVLLEQNWQLIE